MKNFKEYEDSYVEGTPEFQNLYNTLFNNYFPDYTMELIRYDRTTEEYLINKKHTVICHFMKGNCYRITITRRFEL